MKAYAALASVTLGAVVLGATLTEFAAAQAAGDVPTGEAGWTGLTDPGDVVAARQALMTEIERLMRPVDTFAFGDPGDPLAIRSAATSIVAMLLAVPHLFPPTTDLYDPDDPTPTTIALPTIWRDFASFYGLAAAAADAASMLAAAPDEATLRSAGTALRAACDACHATFLRPYVSAPVNTEGLQLPGIF